MTRIDDVVINIATLHVKSSAQYLSFLYSVNSSYVNFELYIA